MDLYCLCVVRHRPCSQLSCISMRPAGSIQDVDCIRNAPIEHRGKGKVVSLRKKDVGDASLLS